MRTMDYTTVCGCRALLNPDEEPATAVRCRCMEQRTASSRVCPACKKGSHVDTEGLRVTQAMMRRRALAEVNE